MVTLSIWRLLDKPVLEVAASSRKVNAALGGLISPPSQLRLLSPRFLTKSARFSVSFLLLLLLLSLLVAGEKVAEPETVANLFASHFANILGS